METLFKHAKENSNTLETMSKMSVEELTNYLSDMDSDTLTSLSVSADILGLKDLANKIRHFHHEKYISKWADTESEKFIVVCDHLHSLKNIDELSLEIEKYSKRDIFFITKIAKKRYPNEPEFYEQIQVQHNRFMLKKIVEFTAAYYSGNLETFMCSCDEIVISNLKEMVNINNLRNIIPDAVQELYNYRKKDKRNI